MGYITSLTTNRDVKLKVRKHISLKKNNRKKKFNKKQKVFKMILFFSSNSSDHGTIHLYLQTGQQLQKQCI